MARTFLQFTISNPSLNSNLDSLHPFILLGVSQAQAAIRFIEYLFYSMARSLATTRSLLQASSFPNSIMLRDGLIFAAQALHKPPYISVSQEPCSTSTRIPLVNPSPSSSSFAKYTTRISFTHQCPMTPMHPPTRA